MTQNEWNRLSGWEQQRIASQMNCNGFINRMGFYGQSPIGNPFGLCVDQEYMARSWEGLQNSHATTETAYKSYSMNKKLELAKQWLKEHGRG